MSDYCEWKYVDKHGKPPKDEWVRLWFKLEDGPGPNRYCTREVYPTYYRRQFLYKVDLEVGSTLRQIYKNYTRKPIAWHRLPPTPERKPI